MKRALLILIVLCLPTGIVLADTASSLGPQTTTGSDASSTVAGGSLQPAGESSSSLQSANATDSGTGQAGIQALQQTGSSDQAKLFVQGDGDAPQSLDDDSGSRGLEYALIVLAIATMLTTALVLARRRLG